MRGRRIGLLAAIIAVLLLALVGSNTGFADTASSTPEVGAYDSNYVYQQIVDHKLPIAPDGKPTNFAWGRYYTGSNGLEFRLNNDATWFVVSKTFETDAALGIAVTTDKIGTMGDMVQDSISSPLIKTALALGNIWVGAVITAEAEKAIRSVLFEKNLCLGITIPPKAMPTALDRAAALARGQTILATQGPYYNDTKVWFEPCAPGDGPKADVAAPPAPPPAPDTQPAVKAAPIVAPPPKAQPAPVQAPAPVSPAPVIQAPPPPPVVAPPAPDSGPVYKDVSMDQICHDSYGGDYHSEYQDPNNYDSWHCVNDNGYSPGGMDVESYCPNTYPGSHAVHEPDDQIPAYWWKCRIG